MFTLLSVRVVQDGVGYILFGFSRGTMVEPFRRTVSALFSGTVVVSFCTWCPNRGRQYILRVWPVWAIAPQPLMACRHVPKR